MIKCNVSQVTHLVLVITIVKLLSCIEKHRDEISMAFVDFVTIYKMLCCPWMGDCIVKVEGLGVEVLVQESNS